MRVYRYIYKTSVIEYRFIATFINVNMLTVDMRVHFIAGPTNNNSHNS